MSIQQKNDDHFNNHAKEYDATPQIKEITQRTSENILEEFRASTSAEHVKNASVLDFGCGTGLCAFLIAPHVKHVLGVDASKGMLEQLHSKLETQAEFAPIKDKVETVNHLVTNDAPLPEPEFSKYLAGPEGGFDMIFSNFVMHHIEDVQGIIDTLASKFLKKDGWLVVMDFEGASHHGHGHGHGHGHEHGHGHGHEHGHHRHEEASKLDGQGHGVEDIHDHFVDSEGKPLDFVAHKGGFTPEGFAEVFKKAGLVDVTGKHSFGQYREINGKRIWTDAMIVKGRRA
ncbi:hypothetical protein BGX28_010379 [Mortierella sp. GBA30]|nr:hypothetical protein BGX28_010379 [Mortierella sp. GBA30]